MGRSSDYGNGMYQQLIELMGRLETVEKDSKEKLNTLNGRISALEKENFVLKKENQLLRDDNARLRSIINHDSSNTSLPPSTDQKGGKPANTYNDRKKTGQKCGGQKGHKGTTLTRAEAEEKIRSGKCRHEIRHMGDISSGKYITKYVVDLRAVPVVTEIRIYADSRGKYQIPQEYRSDVTYGPNVKAFAVALYSEGVMSNDRIAAFLNAVGDGGLGLSAGSIYGFCRKFAERAGESVFHLEEELLKHNVVATDATTVTVNGTQNYIRNFSVEDTVIYYGMQKKSIPALRELSFLKKYGGILVHDHETALYHFGTGHGECNVHLIRYLRKNTEETGNKWSTEMISLLCGMNKARKGRMEQGETAFTREEITRYEQKYQGLISKGYEENKDTPRKYAKAEEKTLLNRMKKYSHNHLLFLHNFDVLFDNNLSERDLRKVKNRQKMSGGFRKGSGQEMYCSILTVIETLKRREMGMIENIKKIFMGTPAIF